MSLADGMASLITAAAFAPACSAVVRTSCTTPARRTSLASLRDFYVGAPRWLPPVLTELGLACLAFNIVGYLADELKCGLDLPHEILREDPITLAFLVVQPSPSAWRNRHSDLGSSPDRGSPPESSPRTAHYTRLRSQRGPDDEASNGQAA